MSEHPAVHRCGYPADWGPLGNLLDLVLQRLALARDVAAVKYASGEPIDDRVREDEVLKAVASALEASGSYQRAGMQFFRDQIEASKVIQRGLHHRWYAHPEEVPAAHRGLASDVRPKIDRINTRIIQQLASVAEKPRMSLGDVADLVDKRLAAEVSARHLPRLHRAAALFAMRSLCAASGADGRNRALGEAVRQEVD
jgi:chorismate mutase